MNNNQYTYNQPPMGQMPPRQMGMPPQMEAPRPRGWRERWMQRFGMTSQMPRIKAISLPHWLSMQAIVFFFISMFACWFSFGYIPEFDLVLISCISIVLFFYGCSTISKSWSGVADKKFVRNVYILGLTIRLLWILYCYFVLNPNHYGTPVGEMADVDWYMPFGKELALWISGDSNSSFSQLVSGVTIDDLGYPVWLGFVYFIFGEDNDIFIPFVLKSLLSAYCAICIYRVAKRHFGEGTARIAALFIALNPNMIYWCGNMFKETEMIFLVCLAVDNFDKGLSAGNRFTFRSLFPGMLATLAVFFFRAPLAIVIFLAVFAHIVMASNRVMNTGKKILAGVLLSAILAVSMGDQIRTQSKELVETAQSDRQENNMEWRGRREGGNSFAKYASAAVFAPLIFTIPFPTFNQANEVQLLQVQLSGGSYIKNIFSFFVILVLLMMMISGEWRRHVFILAYTVGYHVVLVMSSFAQSGRFHMPVWPMLMLFAAYGIQIAKTNARVRRWFPLVLVIEVVACLAWNWFKLKGRGMI